MNYKIKGSLYVALGAISYGTLATVVKQAYHHNYTTAEITIAQFVYGIFGIWILILFQSKGGVKLSDKPNFTSKKQLILTGTSLGFTSIFYYLCVKHINVSIAIVLLMQTVWMGVIVEWLIDKKKPTLIKWLSVSIILLGTLLATNIVSKNITIDYYGLLFGILAACSFTTTLYTANKIALNLPNSIRTLYMLYGGLFIVIISTFIMQNKKFNFSIFGIYGVFLALFGTIIPPILMNKGFPKTGLGLGSILSSLELPVSVTMAFFILKEPVVLSQWLGIAMILSAILILNIPFKKKL